MGVVIFGEDRKAGQVGIGLLHSSHPRLLGVIERIAQERREQKHRSSNRVNLAGISWSVRPRKFNQAARNAD